MSWPGKGRGWNCEAIARRATREDAGETDEKPRRGEAGRAARTEAWTSMGRAWDVNVRGSKCRVSATILTIVP